VDDFGVWNGVGIAEATIGLEYSDFVALAFADSYSLVPQSDYTTASGSTIITFTTAYLDTLSNGTYYYIAEFTDYDTRWIRLIINKPGNYSVTGGAGEGGRPSTGDDPYMLFLTTLLAIISALCLFMLMFYYRYTYSCSRNRRR